MGKDATIHDVAQAAGVSIRTVSRVLNQSSKVNANTRERIEAAIARLGFAPSARARGLATGRSYLIGIIHNDRNALVLDTVQRGVVDVATARGWEVVIHPTPAGDDGSIADVLDFMRHSRVDGVVVMPPVSGVAGMGAALRDAGVPAVALSSRPVDGFAATLIADERAAAQAAAAYLIGLGHRRIALLNGPLAVCSASERRTGFLAGLQAAGLAPVGEAEGDYAFDSGIAAAERLLALDPHPTAIFAANDIMAAAVVKAASARGMAVPGQLSIIGFDGSMLARMLTPSLTSVYRPLGEMARLATRRLLDLVEGVDHPVDLQTPLQLIEGDSSGPAAN